MQSSAPQGASIPGPRRWLRFSLSSLLMLTTLAAILLAVYVRKTRIDANNLAALRPVAKLDQYVYRVATSHDGKRVALVGWKSPVEIRDARSLRLLETVGAGRMITSFAFGPKGRRRAYSVDQHFVELFDTKTGATLRLDAVNSYPEVKFSPDGQMLVTTGGGNEVRLWDTATGRLLHVLRAGNREGAQFAEFSPDGKRLAAANNNFAPLSIFDVNSGAKLLTVTSTAVHDMAFDPTGELLAVALVDGAIDIYRAADGKNVHCRQSGADQTVTLDWSPDGSLLVAAGLYGRITLWRAADMKLLHTLDAPELVHSARFSRDGSRLLTAGGNNDGAMSGGKFTIWAAKTSFNAPRPMKHDTALQN